MPLDAPVMRMVRKLVMRAIVRAAARRRGRWHSSAVAERRRQPRGVVTLALVEMWERFSYYGMVALLVLFLALLVAHAALALAALAIALIEAFDRWGWALVATALGCIVAFGADRVIDRSFAPGARIFLGAVIALAAAVAPLLALLREPDRNLAAAL